MKLPSFEALGFVLLPDGTIYLFGKAIDLITREEVYDPYLWQRCSHEDSLRKLIRMDEVKITSDTAYAPTYYDILKRLIEENHIVFLNRNKKSVVTSATIFMKQEITDAQYDELMKYEILCNQCDHMTISWLENENWHENINVQDLEAFLYETITITYAKSKKK